MIEVTKPLQILLFIHLPILLQMLCISGWFSFILIQLHSSSMHLLENWQSKYKCCTVSSCIPTTSSDTEIYKRLLPLYFPRDKHEEEVALLKLPADVGDENGETTIDERKIRIKPLPNAKKSSPRVPQASVDLSVSNVGLTRLVMNSASALYYTYNSHVGDIRKS
ncbi:hypothetical protein A4A49_07404 [Nicotiana attenuata]|uniref:Uncharacterized protein n=1 Tax=Nicotiana attenuata TaxID=49451 RepID=A0A1J6IKV4_NICAT|nr:hypothetical protein A4A49_07404 [Nicotiana attenuata]